MRSISVVIFCFFISLSVQSQDELLNELEEKSNVPSYVLTTFKGTRVINGHSVETKPEGALEFIISHRFGRLNLGSYELYGLDISVIRLGLEYGITDRFGVGIGRNSEEKIFDGYLKYKLLRQQNDGTPFTITALSSIAYRTLKEEPAFSTDEKLAYAIQAMIARKFSSAFSFQLAPIWLHRNAVDQATEVNDLVALGVGTRVKITRSVSINAEYYARLNEKGNNPNQDAIGVGIDIETGGHVFQLIFTNTSGMTERAFLPETANDFFDGDIHFGFNITRTFQLKRKQQSLSKNN
jgi:hypothetical protein